jgi:hypothetical protein
MSTYIEPPRLNQFINSLLQHLPLMFWFQETRKKKVSVVRRKIEPCSDLWDLVLDMDWKRVIEHAKEHPRDAEWQDGHWHETPLYLACQQNPPVDAIRAIIAAYPNAVLIQSRANKDLPLHIACRYQAAENVLQELVRDFPVTSIEQTRWGRTAVMVLWEFRPKGAPLDDCFWNKIIIVLSAVARFREDHRFVSQTPSSRAKDSRNIYPDHILDTHMSDPDSLSIVYAAVSLGALNCPLEVLTYVLDRYPEQVFQRDRWGQLPMHIAVGPSSWSHATGRKYKPREQEFVSLLLDAHPGAAKERILANHDRYPLHAALVNRHIWDGGIQDLFHAAPEILLVADPLTKLFPFQLAAIPVRDTKVELDTIYHLLRSQPDVLGSFDFHKREDPEEAAYVSTTQPSERCPTIVQDTLLGTITAIFIGSVAGVVFADLP